MGTRHVTVEHRYLGR